MRRPVLLAAYVVAMAVLGFAVILLLPQVKKLNLHRGSPTVARATATATPAPTASPTPAPTPLPLSQYPPDRLVIPSLNVNATWVPLGFMADGVTMDSPVGPQDLGWYTFSDTPGGSSNTVFSGHVDWYTGAATIFQGLRNPGLKEGDEIDVSRDDGRMRTYHVVALNKPDQNVDATDIISPTDVPTVTLITCTGDWNPVTHEYSNRLVVVAQAPPGG
jgi:sortase (surface protein transpeptidase)